MNTSLFIQYVIISVVCSFSLYIAIKQLFPTLFRKLQLNLTLFLLKQKQPLFIQKLGRVIAPKQLKSTACGSCDGCGK